MPGVLEPRDEALREEQVGTQPRFTLRRGFSLLLEIAQAGPQVVPQGVRVSERPLKGRRDLSAKLDRRRLIPYLRLLVF